MASFKSISLVGESRWKKNTFRVKMINFWVISCVDDFHVYWDNEISEWSDRSSSYHLLGCINSIDRARNPYTHKLTWPTNIHTQKKKKKNDKNRLHSRMYYYYEQYHCAIGHQPEGNVHSTRCYYHFTASMSRMNIHLNNDMGCAHWMK